MVLEIERCEGGGFVTLSDGFEYRCSTCDGTGEKKGKIDSSILEELRVESKKPEIADSDSDSNSNPTGEDPTDYLYSSSLEYVDQLGLYRRFKGKKGEECESEIEIDESDQNIDIDLLE